MKINPSQISKLRLISQQLSETTLDTAQQIEAQAAFGQLLASVTMRDLVTGSGIRFQTGAVLKPTATSAAIQLLIVDAASSWSAR